MTQNTSEHARKRAGWWFFYYHFLLYLHFILGIAGVIVGAMVAAGGSLAISAENITYLGVASTIIVGIVSFVQPGRMASIFYDAYWRMQLAVLQSEDSPTAKRDLIAAMTEGYERIAASQPEVLRKEPEATLDVSKLSKENRAAVTKELGSGCIDFSVSF